jgi:hypothetical protein
MHGNPAETVGKGEISIESHLFAPSNQMGCARRLKNC